MSGETASEMGSINDAGNMDTDKGNMLPKKRDVMLKRPGNINVVGDRGSFAGCRVVTFDAEIATGLTDEDADKFYEQLEAEAKKERSGERGFTSEDTMNLYFQHRANLLVVNIYPTKGGGITVLFTNQLEDEEAEEFNAWAQGAHEYMAEWRRKKDEEKEAERAAVKVKKDEEAALIELGRKARDHNLLTKLKELEAEVASLKSQVKAEAKAAKKGK